MKAMPHTNTKDATIRSSLETQQGCYVTTCIVIFTTMKKISSSTSELPDARWQRAGHIKLKQSHASLQNYRLIQLNQGDPWFLTTADLPSTTNVTVTQRQIWRLVNAVHSPSNLLTDLQGKNNTKH